MSLQGVPQEHGYYGDCSVALERVGCWIHDNRQLNYNPTRIRSIKLRGGGGGGGGVGLRNGLTSSIMSLTLSEMLMSTPEMPVP